MKSKYTEEEEKLLINAYTTATDKDAAIEDLVTEIGKSKRSIIAKLSRLGVYKAKSFVSKVTGGEPKTKEAIVKEIANLCNEKDFTGLEKAPKLVLLTILETLKNRR